MTSLCLAFAAAILLPVAAGAVAPAVQVTHGYSDGVSFAPDGRRMMTIVKRDGHEQLAIAKIDGSDLRLLTTAPIDHEDPAWSPDGRRIAYTALAGDGAIIHVMNADGTRDAALTPASQRAIHPSWSPDGKVLLYCSDDDLHPPAKNDSTIYAVDMATRRIRPVITGGTNTYPKYSPDMRWIAFRKMVGANDSEVWAARSDGSKPRDLTNNPAFDGWPDWSPDGARIAFASNRVGNYKIYAMNRDGSGATLVADTPGRGTAPIWTKDGKAIFFTICQRAGDGFDCEVWRAAAPERAR